MDSVSGSISNRNVDINIVFVFPQWQEIDPLLFETFVQVSRYNQLVLWAMPRAIHVLDTNSSQHLEQKKLPSSNCFSSKLFAMWISNQCKITGVHAWKDNLYAISNSDKTYWIVDLVPQTTIYEDHISASQTSLPVQSFKTAQPKSNQCSQNTHKRLRLTQDSIASPTYPIVNRLETNFKYQLKLQKGWAIFSTCQLGVVLHRLDSKNIEFAFRSWQSFMYESESIIEIENLNDSAKIIAYDSMISSSFIDIFLLLHCLIHYPDVYKVLRK
ncbi:hypothetical protein QVD99_001888 [Batrachochytrium dendrobatidis]|nr:hypothetical protein QVD99_001888 [Batrachochytrium dendrobatidis]